MSWPSHTNLVGAPGETAVGNAGVFAADMSSDCKHTRVTEAPVSLAPVTVTFAVCNNQDEGTAHERVAGQRAPLLLDTD